LWEFGWDALVAIGTVALAIATFVAIKQTRRIELSRQRDRDLQRLHQAGYMSVAFDHELQMIIGLTAEVIRVAWRTRRKDAMGTLEAANFALEKIQIPIMLKFAPRVNRFDNLTATMVLVVISRVLQAKLNRMPLGGEEIRKDVASKLSRSVVKTIHSIRREAKLARASLRQYRPAGVFIREADGIDRH
jgi:hypothetical protein